jgi:N6-adenosine-specific RNA methylase IME4
VQRARLVREHGTPELQAEVVNGNVAVSTAAVIARAPAEEQRRILALGTRHLRQTLREIWQPQTEARRAERLQRNEILSQRGGPLPLGRRFPIILADPPYRYEHTSDSRAIENHYPTMAHEEICALQVAEQLAADNALLFLWTPAPMLAKGLDILDAWGFEYRTNLVWWKKGRYGMGHYARVEHEHLLIARRGDMPPPDPANRPRSIVAKPGRHSEKPAEAYELINRAYPGVGKLELFARTAREGWAAWGNEAPM